MKSIKFTKSTADLCIVIVAVYVDDLIIATNTPQNMADVKKELMQSQDEGPEEATSLSWNGNQKPYIKSM
uniref:Uncharacterized protein n=1 Tax=Amphimedon queenslandica TaxID=400682 RepID=A0A1X7TKL1_AMPQE